MEYLAGFFALLFRPGTVLMLGGGTMAAASALAAMLGTAPVSLRWAGLVVGTAAGGLMFASGIGWLG